MVDFFSILWTLFIWCNSLQTADESAGSSLVILELLRPLLSGLRISEDLLHTAVRKLAHVTEFAVLGFLWSATLQAKSVATKKRSGLNLCAAGVMCIFIAVIDETIQRFVPGRSGEFKDICIDVIGVILGLVGQIIAMHIVEHIRLKRNSLGRQ